MSVALVPGTVLGGRYRLDDLLDDVEGARFWRATDVVLERSVAVHVLPEDDERTSRLLDAAKRSATVTDQHLLRVLDADVRDGLAWVINEWGQGQSLDILIAQRPLPPERAAWLVREVALAIAVAHSAGAAHGRLAPENVMVTDSGTVRIIGFATDACLQRRLRRSGNYPRVSDREADVVDLAGLLYAGLVAKWPGASGSMVAPAPRDADGPLRARQVRAGIPRPLDLICGRLLARSNPGRSAHQLAAVLTEYLGEPASPDPALVPAAAAVLGPAEEPAEEPDEEPDEPGTATDATETAVTSATVFPLPPDPDAAELGADELGEDDEPWSEQSEQPEQPEQPAATDAEPEPEPEPEPVDPEATQRVPFDVLDAAATDPDWHLPSGEEPPPLPEPEPVPDRPLFAPEGTTRQPRGDLPRSVTSGWGTTDHAAGASRDTGSLGSPSWPFGPDPEEERDDYEERTRRSWLRLPLAVLLVVVVIAVVASFIGFGGKVRGALPGRSDPTPTTSAEPTAGQRLTVRSAKDLDPYGVPPEENPDEVKAAIDGDPSTAWETSTYRGRADLGGLKPGVGIVLDLGSIQRIGSVAIALVGSPTNLALYTAPTRASAAPSGIEGLTRVAGRDGAGTRIRLTPDRPVRTRYLAIWLTSLPAVDGGFRGGIASVVVRS